MELHAILGAWESSQALEAPDPHRKRFFPYLEVKLVDNQGAREREYTISYHSGFERIPWKASTASDLF